MHIRRYFERARESDPTRAIYVLDHFFAPLYALESLYREQQLDCDDITYRRQKEVVPILTAMRAWMERELPLTILGMPIHKAIAPCLTYFDAMMVYTTDGMLEPDNNLLERQIRAIVLGRKNFMFAGSHRAAQRAAVIYSLLTTCKLQGINPIDWLDDGLHRISDHPEEKLLELLPQYWTSITMLKTKGA